MTVVVIHDYETVPTGCECSCGERATDNLFLLDPADTEMILSDMSSEVACQSCGEVYWI
jgi:redox-regulated HSP33 family molecular chaperone